MAETTRVPRTKSDPNNPCLLNGKEAAKGIMTALDEERTRQGYTMEQVSAMTGRQRSIWEQAVKRGGARMDTIAAVCDLLDVQIVLVDREGRALT